MQNKIRKAFVIILMAINFCGCQTRQMHYHYLPEENSKSFRQPGQQIEYENSEQSVIQSQIKTVTFEYPDNWVETRESESEKAVQDTDLDIVLSTGFVPDDYYLPNGYVNDEKYAEQYILIQLEEYDYQIETEKDWEYFIENHFPQIKSYESYILEPGLLSIEPKEYYGIMLGNKIAIVAVDDKVIAAYLHFQGRNSEEAEKYFENILSSLR